MPIFERRVGASTDDCYAYWNAEWVFSVTTTWVSVGYFSAANWKQGAGMRFLNITVPNGATITTAYITITCSTARSNTVVNSKVRGEDVDDAVTFSNYANYIGRARTAPVDWNAIPAWTVDAEYNSPEIKTIIQTIVDRVGWASGQDMVIFWDDHDDLSTPAGTTEREGYSWNASAAKAPLLHIEYSTGWAGKISGVSSPAKVAGVDVANIAKVKGVA